MRHGGVEVPLRVPGVRLRVAVELHENDREWRLNVVGSPTQTSCGSGRPYNLRGL